MQIIRFMAAVVVLIGAGWSRAETAVLVPVRDNTLYESAAGSLSNGAGSHFFTGRTSQIPTISRRRAVLEFDTNGSVPSGSTVTSVSLTLHMSLTTAGPNLQVMRRVLADWGSAGSDASGQEGAGDAAAVGDATWLHTF